MRRSPGDEALTLTRYHIYGLPQLYEVLGCKSCLWPSVQVKGHKGENFFLSFLFFLNFALFYYSSFYGIMRADRRWWQEIMYNN